MNKQGIIKFCLTVPNTFEDRPFQYDYETVGMKHIEKRNSNFVMEILYKFRRNLKCGFYMLLARLFLQE